MKNLLIWINPKKMFEGSATGVKIQIDNSLDLGWRKEDIILATNFKYEYNGIKSIEVSDECINPYSKFGGRHKAILDLVNKGIVNCEELFWLHDFDAFQSEIIKESELELGNSDFALPDYCWKKNWHLSSIFFKRGAYDIFEAIVQLISLFQYENDEQAFRILKEGITQDDRIKWRSLYNSEVVRNVPLIRNIESRVHKINTSYCFSPLYKLRQCYQDAIKPIKVLHFQPTPKSLNFYMYGNNEINTVLMSKRLIKIFYHHGVK